MSGNETDFGSVSADLAVRTAITTSDGLTTGKLVNKSQFVTLTSANANNIVTLPDPKVGRVVYIQNGATGFEIRTTSPTTIAINGGTGTNAESAIPASMLCVLVCTTLTTWVGYRLSAAGAYTAIEAAAT